MGNRDGIRKSSMPWKRALRAKSRREYGPLSGTSVSGAAPDALNATPSSIGRQSTLRPCRAASASMRCAARYAYGELKSNQNSTGRVTTPEFVAGATSPPSSRGP
jgi:hypothetical protein